MEYRLKNIDQVKLADSLAADPLAEQDFEDARRVNAKVRNRAAGAGDDLTYSSLEKVSTKMAKVHRLVQQALQGRKN